MHLSDIIEYIRRAHGTAIHVELPSRSIHRILMGNRATGRMFAVLINESSGTAGKAAEFCDIRCHPALLKRLCSRPDIELECNLGEQNWIRVKLSEETDKKLVESLIDLAFDLTSSETAEMTLPPTEPRTVRSYSDTPLPRATQLRYDTSGRILGSAAVQPDNADQEVPEKIRQMLELEKAAGYAYRNSKQLFHEQAELMADYEDDAPWEGRVYMHFYTYASLDVPQLRGYFTWRTKVRKGDIVPTNPFFVYIYANELMSGIGADSPEDTLKKIDELKLHYSNPDDYGPAGNVQSRLTQWSFVYAVRHGLPTEITAKYAPAEMLRKDARLAALKNPKQHTDEEVFDALRAYAGRSLENSAFIKKTGDRGKHLFAALWRYMIDNFSSTNGERAFSFCFGRCTPRDWYPLEGVVYWEPSSVPGITEYKLNECRSYRCKDGRWKEKSYKPTPQRLKRLKGIIHEADRLFRLEWKIASPLTRQPVAASTSSCITDFINEEKRAEAEAARPKVKIDFSALSQIRKDAGKTRDSLLTEEETADHEPDAGTVAAVPTAESFPAEDTGLDSIHRQILALLLNGESVQGLMEADHLIPSVVADTINEALFDEIGDNVVEYDDSRIYVVEDYKEDVSEALGGVVV